MKLINTASLRLMSFIETTLARKDGMELVQVAILVAIAIVIGVIFRTQIVNFVNSIFKDLQSSKFK